MDFKGTKGQWEPIYHSWSDASVCCGDKTICTNSVDNDDYEEDKSTEENEFNIQLIAAAPDLLEALSELLKVIDAGNMIEKEHYEDWEKDLIMAQDKAKVAIKKALE